VVNALVADGMKLKEAVSEVAATNNASKSELYQLVLDSRTA
jgi:16S rRNA C1402 (ribose-2'-O) methylase RsmI